MKTLTRPPLRALTLLLATVPVLGIRAQADEPDAEPRLFATSGACVDWDADTSRRIVAHRAGNTWDVIRFGTPDFIIWFSEDFLVRDSDGQVLLDLAGTTWAQVPVLHVTDSGADYIRLAYWLVDDGSAPDTGLTAATGPDGDVVPVAAFEITRIVGGYGDNSGKFRVLPGGGGELFCVSAALLNR